MMKSAFWCIFSLVSCILGAPEPPVENSEATEGGQAKLPCPLEPLHTTDKPTLVMWFKGASEGPIYKYDLRGVRPQHWSESGQENRLFFRVSDSSERAELTIAPIRLTDEDLYRCQVDFFRSPTRITSVNLTVIGEYLDMKHIRKI